MEERGGVLIVMISEGTPFEYSVSTILLDLLTSQFFGPAKSQKWAAKNFLPFPPTVHPMKSNYRHEYTIPHSKIPLFYVEEKELRINHHVQSK